MFRAAHIRKKCGNKQLSSSLYLSEAEPFLEQYAGRSPKNQGLIGSAGNLVRAEDFLALVDGDLDEEGDLVKKERVAPATPEPAVKEAVQKDGGLIVFFPGIPLLDFLYASHLVVCFISFLWQCVILNLLMVVVFNFRGKLIVFNFSPFR